MIQRTIYTIILIFICLVPIMAQDNITPDTVYLKKIEKKIPPKSTMARLINRNWFEIHLKHLWTNRSYSVSYTETKRIVTQLSDSGTVLKRTEYDYYLSGGKDKQFKQDKVGKSFNGNYIVFRDTTNSKNKVHNIHINSLKGSILKQKSEKNKKQMLMCDIDINQGRKFHDIETTMKLLCHKEWVDIEDGSVWYFEKDVKIAYWDNYRKKKVENYYLTDKVDRNYNRSLTAKVQSGKYIAIRTYNVWEGKQRYKGPKEYAFFYRIIHLSANKLIVRSVQPPGSHISEYECEFICE